MRGEFFLEITLTIRIHEIYPAGPRFNKGKRTEITKGRSHRLEFVYDIGGTKSFSSSAFEHFQERQRVGQFLYAKIPLGVEKGDDGQRECR